MKGSEEVQHTETRSFSTLTLLQVGQEARAHMTFIQWRDSKLVSLSKTQAHAKMPKNLKFDDVSADYY